MILENELTSSIKRELNIIIETHKQSISWRYNIAFNTEHATLSDILKKIDRAGHRQAMVRVGPRDGGHSV